MDTTNDKQYKPDKPEDAFEREKETQDQRSEQVRGGEAAPGVPIIRGNTPRPFMYSTMTAVPPSTLPEALPQEAKEVNAPFSTVSAFPTKPPSAPPLPEEADDYDDGEGRGLYASVATNKSRAVSRERQEFVWLFEYGLEMDSAHLNAPERLGGLALLYGTAVLKGYRLFLGSYEDENFRQRTLTTIVPDARPGAEVWGVVYRVVRHVTRGHGNEPALLETVHALPRTGMSEMQVEVIETYRNRPLSCVTYGYQDAERAAQYLSPIGEQSAFATYMRRLTSIAVKQKLPEEYIKRLGTMDMSVPVTPARSEPYESLSPATALVRTEQHTEPIMMSVEKLPVAQVQAAPAIERKSRSTRWFVAFAIYLFCLLLVVLALATVQGMGIANDVLNDNFMLFHVPWLVLLYGLLGACVSSIVTLGRTTTPVDAPIFVIVTWFTRPFVGAVLALFAYLLLSSGFFAGVSGGTNRPEAMFLLVGAVAGMCEGWLFLRKR